MNNKEVLIIFLIYMNKGFGARTSPGLGMKLINSLGKRSMGEAP